MIFGLILQEYSMDYIQLKQAILANSDCTQYVITNDMPKDRNYYIKDSAIADIFNAPVGVRYVERFENFVGLMAALGIGTYDSVMSKLRLAAQSSDLMSDFLLAIRTDQGINFGDTQTHAALNNLVSQSLFTQEEADLLINLSAQPSSLAYRTVGQPITAADVSIALRNY